MKIFLPILFFLPGTLFAQSLHEDLQGIWRAQVVNIVEQETRPIPGTQTPTLFQSLNAKILEGERKGDIVTVENDYLALEAGDHFFLNYLITVNGDEVYSVADADRRGSLLAWAAAFAALVIWFGGKQGLRSLASLAGSFFIIGYLLLPSLLSGFSPVLISSIIAGGILFFGIFITHGFNRESSIAFVGTMSAVALTSILAHLAVGSSKLTGFSSDESVFLNTQTAGALDIHGLLLGGIIIGILGVLDDIAVTQSAVVSELFRANPALSRKDAYDRALRVGKEHVSALVNTLALAYAGAALPLLLLFSNSAASNSFLINGEIFATEIIRTIVGSMGLILTVPITTFLAVRFLKDRPGAGNHSHHHSH